MSKDHDEAMERVLLHLLVRVQGEWDGNRALQFAQAYEAVCNGAVAMATMKAVSE